MSEIDPILIGKGENLQFLLPSFGNRHGLITGATGTGKTVTLQVLAEGFSRICVPVFLADVKGDLAGLSQPISPHPKIDERLQAIGIEEFTPAGQTAQHPAVAHRSRREKFPAQHGHHAGTGNHARDTGRDQEKVTWLLM